MTMKLQRTGETTQNKHRKTKCKKGLRSEKDGALVETSPGGAYTPGSLTELLRKFARSRGNSLENPSKTGTEGLKRVSKRKKEDDEPAELPSTTQGTDLGELSKVHAFFSTSVVPPAPEHRPLDESQRDGILATTAAFHQNPVAGDFKESDVGSPGGDAVDEGAKRTRVSPLTTQAGTPSGTSESPEERLRRTLFVGNLPVHVSFKRSQLCRHLGITPSQVESIRFRSVPVDPKFYKCKRAGIAQQKFAKGCDSQNAYLVLRDEKLVQELRHREFEPFLNHDLRVDSAARTGFSLFDRKRSVCVGGLPSTATEGDLKVALEKFGKVQSCRILRDRITSASKKIGFVCFQDRVSATKAVIEEKCSILGKEVRLMRALSEQESKAVDTARLRGSKGRNPAIRRIEKKTGLHTSRRVKSESGKPRDKAVSGVARAARESSARRQSSGKGSLPPRRRGNRSDASKDARRGKGVSANTKFRLGSAFKRKDRKSPRGSSVGRLSRRV